MYPALFFWSSPMFTTPHEVQAAFYQAMRQADLHLMMSVWATDDDTLCIHPGGMHALGFHAIQSAWQQIFAAGPIQVRTLSEGLTLQGTTTVHSVIEEITLVAHPEHQTHYCYATNIFQRTAQGWKMVLHHASHAPMHDPLFDPSEPAPTLH